MQHPIAVYGTLKQGHGNHHLLEGNFHTSTTVKLDGFEMYSVGTFPFIKRGEGEITVELYWLKPDVYDQVMRNMDWLEGYDAEYNEGFYKRELVDVQLPGGKSIQAWIYVAGNVARPAPRIESGVWQIEKSRGRFSTV